MVAAVHCMHKAVKPRQGGVKLKQHFFVVAIFGTEKVYKCLYLVGGPESTNR